MCVCVCGRDFSLVFLGLLYTIQHCRFLFFLLDSAAFQSILDRFAIKTLVLEFESSDFAPCGLRVCVCVCVYVCVSDLQLYQN